MEGGNVQFNNLGDFNSVDSDGGVTQLVPAPGVGYLAYSSNGVTTCQPSPSGGINYYGSEGRNSYTASRPAGKGVVVYMFEM